jgi:hypothetical protein
MREFAKLQQFLGNQTRDSQSKGRRRENRLWKAFTKYKSYTARDAPVWYRGIRRATRYEDRNGADFFIQTKLESMPEIPINVKASFNAVDLFLEKQRIGQANRSTILVPVGNELDHSQCIRVRTFTEIERRYADRLAICV